MRNENLLTEISNGKEVFFENSFEEIAFRNIPEGGYEGKEKGATPYKVEGAPNKLVEAILEGKMISKEEYQKY
tara:strand:+ start:278 stop:496 length:219 start_codon:yes stop_codon:yes gene_type:complete